MQEVLNVTRRNGVSDGFLVPRGDAFGVGEVVVTPVGAAFFGVDIVACHAIGKNVRNGKTRLKVTFYLKLVSKGEAVHLRRFAQVFTRANVLNYVLVAEASADLSNV